MFIVLETNTFCVGTNAFCASDKRFSAGDEGVENARSKFSPTQLHYQRLSNRTSLEMTATHRYLPLKTGSSYNALVLTSKNATPTSYIRNSVLCWTKQLQLD